MAPITQEQVEKDTDAHRLKIKEIEKRMKRVRFLVGQPPYCAGETAGFPPEIAERLVKATIQTDNGRKKVAMYADEVMVLRPKNDGEEKPNA